MIPTIEFKESNTIMQKPKGMENCSDLNVWKGNDNDGTPLIISKWKPTDEEKDMLLSEDGFVYLTIVGNSMPPVGLSIESPFVKQ